MKEARHSWQKVVWLMYLANHDKLQKAKAQALMDEHFTAEELPLRERHPELTS